MSLRSILVFLFCTSIFLGTILATPHAQAQSAGLVPDCPLNDPGCSNTYAPDNYGTCEVVLLVNNIIGFSLGLVALLATITLVVSGYRLVMSQGNPGEMQRAKEALSNILIGLVIVLSAFLVINTVLSVLVGDNPSIKNWNNIQCSYANKAGTATSTASIDIKPHPNGLLSQTAYNQIISTIDPSLLSASGGVCTSGTIQKVWGSLAPQANCIITHESACGARPISFTDLGADGNPFSFGVMQINTTVHVIRGCGQLGIQDLDCKNAWSGKDFKARVVNTQLYNACRAALLNPECNMINGRRIYQEAGNSWRPWSTAKSCGLQ